MITCETFRTFNTDHNALIKMSRGERLSCAVHYHGCSYCRNYIASLSPLVVPSSEEAIKILIEMDRIKQQDMADPEFRETLEKAMADSLN